MTTPEKEQLERSIADKLGAEISSRLVIANEWDFDGWSYKAFLKPASGRGLKLIAKGNSSELPSRIKSWFDAEHLHNRINADLRR